MMSLTFTKTFINLVILVKIQGNRAQNIRFCCETFLLNRKLNGQK